jgi:hypothetical protein
MPEDGVIGKKQRFFVLFYYIFILFIHFLGKKDEYEFYCSLIRYCILIAAFALCA